MKKLSILGSTGSIGKQSLDVVRMRGFSVIALTANNNVNLLENQAREFHPKMVALHDENSAKDLKIKLADTDIKVLSGVEGLCECAQAEEADTVLNSVVGMVGLKPTVSAIEAKKEIALANKETLVAAGKLVTDKARENSVNILPVDSEHSAIFQSLGGCVDKKMIKRLILTASGGPFFGKKREELQNVTVKDALNHPNWEMGAKITVDSATMMNKGLEIIEAAWLFDMNADNIDVVVHRQSIVHSLVEYVDNSVIAQLGVPDMRIPIQYALTYPERYESPVKQLNLTDFGTLTFEKADENTFSCIKYCKDALRRGGTATAIANSANEEANKLFREGKIKFLQIADLVGEALETIPMQDTYSLQDIFETDEYARNFVRERSGNN